MTKPHPTLALVIALAGCTKGTKAAVPAHAGAADDQSAAIPTVRVEPDGGDYLFSYYAPDGKLKDVSALSAIPEDARKQVMVRDLSRSPQALKSDQYLYLADLRGAAPADGYTTSVVSRYQFDAQGDVLGDSTADDDGGTSNGVIVYGTSWCGACKAARAHLKEAHIPFVEKDIEQEPAAAQELARKAKKAGLKLGGVPVIDVLGTLMMGFDPGAIDRAWSRARQ